MYEMDPPMTDKVNVFEAISFALFVIHTFASSVYLSLCFLEKLNRLTFTLSIHLCFIYLFTH